MLRTKEQDVKEHMSETAQQQAQDPQDDASLPNVTFPDTTAHPDWMTILGLTFSVGLILLAILLGGDGTQTGFNFEALIGFVNGQSLLIVLLGTLTATAISYTVDELRGAGSVIGQAITGSHIDPSEMSISLIECSIIAKKRGILALSAFESELDKDPFLKKSMQMVIDGYPAKDIDFFLLQEIDGDIVRHKRSAGMTRRASEVAPAMGLIGTLVGLVLMLGNLESPETIGPSMAVALLTTFYGAILGTIIMAPLTVKLEKRSNDQTLIRMLIRTACLSIARQDNPRKLEMLLNAELPPSQQVRYFD